METKKAKNVWFKINGKVVGYSCNSITFDRNNVYVKMNNCNCNKYTLLCDGVTFDESTDFTEMTICVKMENLHAIEF